MTRRELVRRLEAALARLDAAPGPDERRLIEDPLARLEEAAGACAQRLNEAELRARRLEGALHGLAQGVVVCDNDGEVVFRNAAAVAFSGARHGDALAERALNDLLAEAVDGEHQHRTVELFGPPRRTLAVSAGPLGDEDDPIGAAATVDDVSERTRLEAIRRDFVANISHELKTPVGALGLIADALEGERDPETVERLIGRVQGEVVRLNRMIEDLLDLSNIEDEIAPRRDPVDPAVVVVEALDQVRAMAERRRITLRFAEPPTGVTVLGDHRQLVSALHNLLENAVKYSDSSSVVEVGVSCRDGSVEFDVRDHGIGIPTRDQERIFERFYRVDKARARDTGGTGLGLAIVRHVADNHGGRVAVVSREGAGSTFTLSVPAAPSAPVLASWRGTEASDG